MGFLRELVDAYNRATPEQKARFQVEAEEWVNSLGERGERLVRLIEEGPGQFCPPDFVVACDTCDEPLWLCSPRSEGRKYDIGDGHYRCHPCQDATGIEPRYDERYAL